MTLWRQNDIRKFNADAILFREIQCKTRDILMLKRHFKRGLALNKVNYARITITHVCSIVLTLNQVPGLMFEHLADRLRVQTTSLGSGKC